jgi:hypothetical protein
MNDQLDARLGDLGARIHGDTATSTDDLDDVYGRRQHHDQRARQLGVLAGVVALVLISAAVVAAARVASRDSQGLDLGGSVPTITAPGPAPSTSATPPTPTSETVPTTAPSPTSTPRSTTAPAVPPPAGPPSTASTRGYQLLFPFASPAEAAAWQADPAGHQPWHTSAELTATAFAGFLGFTDVDQTYGTTSGSPGDAHVTIGFANPAGQPVHVAVVHLIRLGSGDGAPWEVVGTDDILGLSLEAPRYGSTVSSPVAAGGRITGVDESIRVRAYRLGASGPVGDTPGVPGGGEGSPWSSTVGVAPGSGTVILVASTGGHLAGVERFAVTGVQLV